MKGKEIINRISKIGIFEPPMENVVFNDEPKFPAYLTFPNEKALRRYNAEDIVGQGYDTSTDMAKLKSMAEFLERICLYNPNPESLSEKVTFSNGFIDPVSFYYPNGSQDKSGLIRSEKYTWIKGRNLLSNEDVMVPAQRVFISDFNEYPIHTEVTSNGTAFGSIEDGGDIERGLLELVERDACMFSYLSKRRVSRIVGLPQELQKLVDYLGRYRLECHSFDAMGDLGIPTVFTMTLDYTGIGPAVSMGSSSKRNYHDALKRSILESIQCRNYSRLMKTRYNVGSISESEINSLEPRLYYWYPTERIDDLDFWISSPEINFGDISDKEIDFGEMKNTLKEMKFNMISVDISVPEIRDSGFRCTKVIIPELHPLYLDENAKVVYSKHYGMIPDNQLKPHPFT